VLNFVPSHTIDFEQLWTLIATRNRWFINVRYFVVVMFAAFVLVMQYLFKINFTSEQFWAFTIIAVSIFLVNILYNYIDRSGLVKNDSEGFNQLHFAFNQIIIDLLAIALITYYTGGIESPFYLFFVFHMIIGSMILPNYVVYSLSGIIISYMGFLSYFEFKGSLMHYTFGNLLAVPLYTNPRYIIIFVTAFTLMMLVSVFLANNISRAHFLRSQQLKLTLNRLKNAEKTKMKYTMGIVHEIKSPIVGAQSNLDLVLKGYTGEVNPVSIEKINRARIRTDEAIAIINDILKISKLKLLESLHKEEVNIVKFIENNFAKKDSQILSMQVSTKITDKRKDKLPVMIDTALFELVFSNLIGNAVKYNMPGGNIEVILGINENGEVEIVVADDGMGIPDEDKSKMFHEFYRSSNAKHKGIEGTGLGLSVVKEIVEQHDGTISFNSPSRITKEGRRGTEFILTLPAG
jgi:signal transduction histidine kinase